MKKVVKKIAPKSYARAARVKGAARDIRQTLHRIDQKLNEADDRLDKLRRSYARADPYQPIYGIAGIGTGQRDTRDRCEAIYEHFDHNVRGLRVLDVGCFFGYLSFYLADRGARVVAWDNELANIEVCNDVKAIVGLPVDFHLKTFGPETIQAMGKDEYDVVFILSVLHWLVALHGLEYVQDCMKLLMDKVPVLIVELAVKGENNKLFWDKAVPENELDIFAKVKDIKVEKLTEFPTHLSGKQRPVYKVTKKHVTVNGHSFNIVKTKDHAYANAPAWRPMNARYIEGENVFIKQYFYDDLLEETQRYMLNEINFLLQNSSMHNKDNIPGVPKIIDFEIGKTSTSIVVEKIEGSLLNEALADGSRKGRLDGVSITGQLIEILAAMEKRGLHHNDLRSWNIMLDASGKVKLIDFELVSTIQYENNIVAFFWVLCALATGKQESSERNKIKLPHNKDLKNEPILAKLLNVYTQNKNTNFVELYNEFKKLSKSTQRKG